MGASTSLSRRISCAGGSSGIRRQQWTPHQDSERLSSDPTGNSRCCSFHPTPNLPLNQNLRTDANIGRQLLLKCYKLNESRN